jgi:RHS repeat-associated protein
VDDAGNVQAHYIYDAFGGTVSQSGDMDDDFAFRFSSKYLDDETGFYYYGYRYYDSSARRWLSRDPIEEEADCCCMVYLTITA